MSTPEEQIRAMRDAEARDRAEDFARQQMTGILKMEEKRAKEEEQRRLLAEEESKRRVREATEIANRARAEREKFERERERQRKLAEAEAQALARAKARAEQPRESRWKIYVAVMVLLAAVVVGLFEVLPFNTYLGRVEQAMSTALGEKVAIKSMHASLIPRPNIRLTDVVVGTGPGSATIASVHAVPTLSSLFTGPLKFEAEDDDSESEAYARACIIAAREAGISRAEIDAVYRDLGPHMSSVIDSIIEARIERGTRRRAPRTPGAPGARTP